MDVGGPTNLEGIQEDYWGGWVILFHAHLYWHGGSWNLPLHQHLLWDTPGGLASMGQRSCSGDGICFPGLSLFPSQHRESGCF